MRIAVIGSGYVGLVSAACFAEIGHEVISVDNDEAKVRALERGETPIHEHFLPELLKRHHGGRLRFSTSVSYAVEELSASLLTEIYQPLTSGAYYQREDAIPCFSYPHSQARLILTDSKSAELIKHASNAFLAMKISFVNAVANIAESVGADIEQ